MNFIILARGYGRTYFIKRYVFIPKLIKSIEIIKERKKMNYTLKELIKEYKKRDMENDLNTEISVFITSIGNDKKRHTIVVNPNSRRFMDTMAIMSFEDCTVFDTRYVKLSGKDRLLMIIVDLDKHYENATYDKWWSE